MISSDANDFAGWATSLSAYESVVDSNIPFFNVVIEMTDVGHGMLFCSGYSCLWAFLCFSFRSFAKNHSHQLRALLIPFGRNSVV